VETFEIQTTEMHTGGEPVRIIESGFPDPVGTTLLDKRRYVRANLDHLRTALMLEPRGHDDMYGALLVTPDLDEADLAVLFLHNEGYSTMCGHATIALGRYAVERGLVTPTPPQTHLVLQCPCGPVHVWVDTDRNGRAGSVRFHSVDAFAAALDLTPEVTGFGPVVCDLAYGGAFYAIARAAEFGLDVTNSSVTELVAAATALTEALRGHPALIGAGTDDLHDLYGSILIDDESGAEPSTNICVFADAQVDRSPTGSGVTARLALAAARGEIRPGEARRFRSLLGTEMSGSVVSISEASPHPIVTVEVGGMAHFTGRSTFTWEAHDPLAKGFRLR
jgi:trans-L-3-hydroxyproline dehydratase